MLLIPRMFIVKVVRNVGSALLLLKLAAPLGLAQGLGSVAPSCGPAGQTFDALESGVEEMPTPAKVGQARLIFIQDDGPDGLKQHYTIVIGIDGRWMGAYKHNAWFAVDVDPGQHHVCAKVQSGSSFGKAVALAHLDVEAGKTYFFRTQFPAGLATLYPMAPYLIMDRPDSDEALYLLKNSRRSTAVLKK